MPGRIFSFFENPNSYANVLIYFSPLMLCMFFVSDTWPQRLAFLGIFCISVVALLMTYSRGGWLAFAFSMFVLMLIACPRWVPCVMVLGVCCLPFLPSSILNRLLTLFTGDSSISTRNYIYAGMLRLIGHYPVLGAGLGTEAVKHSMAYTEAYQAEALFFHGHNIYFQIWAESGIFALLSFLLGMFHTMRQGIRSFKVSASPKLKAIMAGCISGFSGSLLFGLTDYPWSYPRLMVLFWFLLAILCAAIHISKLQEHSVEV